MRPAQEFTQAPFGSALQGLLNIRRPRKGRHEIESQASEPTAPHRSYEPEGPPEEIEETLGLPAAVAALAANSPWNGPRRNQDECESGCCSSWKCRRCGKTAPRSSKAGLESAPSRSTEPRIGEAVHPCEDQLAGSLEVCQEDLLLLLGLFAASFQLCRSDLKLRHPSRRRWGVCDAFLSSIS